MDIDVLKKEMKNKKNKQSKSAKRFLFKFLVIVIIFLATVISVKKSEAAKIWIKNNLLSENFSFSKIKNEYNKYFGSILPFDKIVNTTPVFNEKLVYKELNKYNDGISLTVDENYLVPVQYTGIVVFIGEKEGDGNTVIVESENVTMWYSNITSDSIKLYDYIEEGKYLGEVIGNKLYLVFKKQGEIVDYKEYI